MELNNNELGIVLLALHHWIRNDKENRVADAEKIELHDRINRYMQQLELADTNKKDLNN